MKASVWLIPVKGIALATLLVASSLASAESYELTKHNVLDPKSFTSTDVSLYGVKLGDPENKAVDILVNEKISGVKAEMEGIFVLLLDQRKPTGPMAGIQLMDGRVNLIFINNRFAYKTRGVFRRVLNSDSPDDVQRVLGPADYGDQNIMGAELVYERAGYKVNYLGKDINVEFMPLQ